MKKKKKTTKKQREAGRILGKSGGPLSGSNMTKEERINRARKAAQTRWSKNYGKS